MQSEMRRPEMPDIDRYLDTVDQRLRAETQAHRRAIPPYWMPAVARLLRALAKPLAQSGAMAITALAIILAMSATPSARPLQSQAPSSAPLASPSQIAVFDGDGGLRAFLNPDEVMAVDSLPDAGSDR